MTEIHDRNGLAFSFTRREFDIILAALRLAADTGITDRDDFQEIATDDGGADVTREEVHAIADAMNS